MNRIIALGFVTAALLTQLGCEEEDSCDRYADYVCDCHEGEEGFDCEALRQLAEAPSQSTIDQCAIDLQAQQEVDDDSGLTCTI